MLRALGLAAVAAAGAAHGQTSIRYDFTLEVVSNTVSVTDPGTTFVDVPVGALGVLSIEASTTPIAGFGDANTLAYAILSSSATIGGIDIALDQSAYPSMSFLTGLNISDNVTSPFLGPNADLMGAVMSSTLPDAAGVFFSLGAPGDGALAPGLWDSTELPAAIDLTAPGLQGRFFVEAPNRVNADGVLLTSFTGVEITPIPSPASAAAFGAACCMVFGRRR